MARFAKNGSDATTAAVKPARAHTGRDRVGICLSGPTRARSPAFGKAMANWRALEEGIGKNPVGRAVEPVLGPWP